MTVAYRGLAYVYDRLMNDVDDQPWFTYLERMWDSYQHAPKKVLDLGCGTGAITIPLAKQGYDVIGIDTSDNMLAIAHQKSYDLNLSLQWIQQDVRTLHFPYAVDTIIAFCDVLNYITQVDELKATLQRIHDHLEPGGMFLFDCHTVYKLQHVFGNNTFVSTETDVAYIWECQYDHHHQLVDHDLSLFIRDGETYRRYNEWHQQRAYTTVQLRTLLQESGFEVLDLSNGDPERPSPEKWERLFCTVRRQ